MLLLGHADRADGLRRRALPKRKIAFA